MILSRPAPAKDLSRWYLVNTQTGRERLAMEHLQRQDYHVFTPWTRKTVRHARKMCTVRAAFFPGYVFVNINIHRKRWRPIDGTIGVLRLVKAGSSPLPAPAGLVEGIIEAADGEGLVSFPPQLGIGDDVRIMSGPFAERLAVIEALPSADRVRVLLEIMNQAVRVEMDTRDVSASHGSILHGRHHSVTRL